jgi:predicted alpha/beta hydrolase family esterase
MTNTILFIQGGGDDGYHADQPLVTSLQKTLGEEYAVAYPEMPSDESLPDFGWIQQITSEISKTTGDLIIVAHSLGASMMLKYLSENSVQKKITGIFLIAAPFWSGDEDWKKGLKLKQNFANELPKDIPLHFYQCKDDEEVSFTQFEQYKKRITYATFHEFKTGGHQFNNDLSQIAKDIKLL